MMVRRAAVAVWFALALSGCAVDATNVDAVLSRVSETTSAEGRLIEGPEARTPTPELGGS